MKTIKCSSTDFCNARHSYVTLNQPYDIPREKLSLIYNSIPGPSQKTLSKAYLRNNYRFSQSDKIVIFARRIDLGEGIFELAQAFKQIAAEYSGLRLVIVGDRAYSTLLTQIKPMWNDIILMGYVVKILYTN